MSRVRSLVTVPALVAASVVAGGAHTAGAANVPDLVLGADAADSAIRVDAPVVDVTVYSDRARVRRRGRVSIPAGGAGAHIGVVRFPDLPGAVFLDTVRVGAKGGRVLRVESTPIARGRFEIAQAKTLLDQFDAVNDRLAELKDRTDADQWELTLLEALVPAAPVPEDKREGRKGLTVDPGSWWKALDFLRGRMSAARVRQVAADDDRRQLLAERDRVRAALAQLNQGGFSDRSVQVVAVLDAAGAHSVDVELEYFVPGARWKPAYNIYYTAARGQLTMETVAVVQQTTGEDWTRAALAFSTAIPGRGIDLPELLTWTLGERSDFVPQLRPRQPPRVDPMLPMPVAPSSRADQQEGESQAVRDRLSLALAGPAAAERDELLEGGPLTPPPPVPSAIRDARMHRLLRPSSSNYDAAGPAASAPAMAPAEPAQELAEEEAEAPAPIAMREVMATSQLAKRAPGSASDAASTRSMALSLYDAPSTGRSPVLADPNLPAVSGGGLDYVYRGPASATVNSDGKETRIPLAAQAFRTAAFYEATPALATTAFLRARVRNDGKRPLLRGPVAVFGDGEFIGQGEIQTTGPGGDIEFPLGADQDIRLVRQVVPTTKTTGLIMKSQVTEYDVQLQIGNYKKQAVTVEVVDQIPRSRNDDVEIKLLGMTPAPQVQPDVDGVVRWRVAVPASATQVIKLRYQITRPKDWQLYQR